MSAPSSTAESRARRADARSPCRFPDQNESFVRLTIAITAGWPASKVRPRSLRATGAAGTTGSAAGVPSPLTMRSPGRGGELAQARQDLLGEGVQEPPLVVAGAVHDE